MLPHSKTDAQCRPGTAVVYLAPPRSTVCGDTTHRSFTTAVVFLAPSARRRVATPHAGGQTKRHFERRSGIFTRVLHSMGLGYHTGTMSGMKRSGRKRCGQRREVRAGTERVLLHPASCSEGRKKRPTEFTSSSLDYYRSPCGSITVQVKYAPSRARSI